MTQKKKLTLSSPKKVLLDPKTHTVPSMKKEGKKTYTKEEKAAILERLSQEAKHGKSAEELKKEFLFYFPEEEVAWEKSSKASLPSFQEIVSSSYDEEENPLVLMAEENGALRALSKNILLDSKGEDEVAKKMLEEEFNRLSSLFLHYQKKEEILFPYLKKLGIEDLAERKKKDEENLSKIQELKRRIEKEEEVPVPEIRLLLDSLESVIVDENRFLLPVLDENLSEEELIEIKKEMDTIGYFLIRYPKK